MTMADGRVVSVSSAMRWRVQRVQCLIPVSVSERCCFPSECRVCDAFYRPCIGMSDLVVRPMFSRCYIFSRAFDGAAWPVSSPGWCTDSQLESMFSWRGVGLFVVLYRSVVESNFGRYCQWSAPASPGIYLGGWLVRLIARVGTYQFH